MKLVTPPAIPLKSFTDPVKAWEYVCEIYDRNTGFIRDHLLNLTKGQVPPGKIRAHYPKVQVLSTSFQQQANSRLAYGFLHSPGLYQTTLTQPALFHKYLIENFSLILKNHGGQIEVGESETPIPLHFAVDPKERVEGDTLLDIGVPLRDLFDVPDLAHMDDEIANGTFIPPSGGPYPLAYVGLGDVFVFLFFGLAAVVGTTWVQTLSAPPQAWLAGSAIGLLATAILVVNNLRDRLTDAAASKRTLAVRWGARAARREHAVEICSAFLIVWCSGAAGLSPAGWSLMTVLCVPLAVIEIRAVYAKDGAALNPHLAGAARLELFFGLALAAGCLL